MTPHTHQPQPQSRPPFNPSPETIQRIIADFLSASLTLPQIAHAHNIGVFTLVDFIARPDIRQRLDDIEAANNRRLHLALARARPAAILALARIAHESAAYPPGSREHRNGVSAARTLSKLLPIPARSQIRNPKSRIPNRNPRLKATLLPHPALPQTFNPANN